MSSMSRNCKIRQTRYLCLRSTLRSLFAIAVILCVPAVAISAGAKAYVVANGFSYDTPGSVTPFFPKKGALGAAYFIPSGGNFILVAPGTKQIWEAVSNPISITPLWLIDILDPRSGSTLATIPLSSFAVSMIIDAAGRYVYVSMGNGDLLKIDVSSRSIVQTLSLGNIYALNMVLSGDGSKLFLRTGYGILVIQPSSLKTIAVVVPYGVNSIFVSGSTLLVTNAAQLLYFNTSTLQQTNSATISSGGTVFGVSPDASKIYLFAWPYTIQILDFSSGQTLASQPLTTGFSLSNVLLSPDGTYILVASNPVLIVNSETLATIKTVESVGIPNSAVYLDPDTVLLLNGHTGVMEVIDQSSAAVTASFPLGVTSLTGEVADLGRDVVYVGGSGNPNVISEKSNRIAANLPDYGFSPVGVAGSRLYGFLNGAVAFYNLTSGQSGSLPLPVIGPNYYVDLTTGALPPDGKTFWAPFVAYNSPCCDSLPRSSTSTTQDGLAVYSTATNGLASLTGLPNGIAPISSIVFSPDSSTAYLAGSAAMAVYNAQTFKILGSFNYTTTFASLAISSDGSVLYAYDGNAVYVLDARTGAQKQVFALPSQPPLHATGPIALSPDGTTIFVTDYTAGAVDLVSTATGQVIQVPVPYIPSSVVVLPSN